MLVEKPARTLVGKIAGSKTGHRHGLLDHLLCRWRYAQFEPLGFVFPLGRCWLLTCGWHDHSPLRLVRQFTVLGKSDGTRPVIRSAALVNEISPRCIDTSARMAPPSTMMPVGAPREASQD